MEILILIAIGAVAIFWGLSKLNKADYHGSHPLDFLAKEPVVNNKTGEVVDQVPTLVTEVVAEPKLAATQPSDVTQAVEPAKKPRKPRVTKPAKAVKQTAVKEKAAKPVKAAALKATVKRSKKA